MHDLALEPGSLLVLVCAPPLVRRAVPGQVTRTERKIMGFTFWIVALILVHVAFLFIVPWE